MRARNFELIKRILELVHEGHYPAKIAALLNVSSTLIYKHLARLEKEGIVQATTKYPKFYEQTGKRFQPLPSLPVRNPFLAEETRLHDFKVKIPIVRFGRRLRGEKAVPINNWVKRYTKEDLPVRATLEITTESAIIHFHETLIPNNTGTVRAIAEFAIAGTSAVCGFLGVQGYLLDAKKAKVISQHLATRTAEEIDRQISEGTVYTLNLGRPAKTSTGTMKQEGKAWTDRSPGPSELETNDLEYKDAMLKMPIRIRHLYALQSRYAENLEKHLAAVEGITAGTMEMRDTLKEIRKSIKQFVKISRRALK